MIRYLNSKGITDITLVLMVQPAWMGEKVTFFEKKRNMRVK
jgi:hypothetical protein